MYRNIPISLFLLEPDRQLKAHLRVRFRINLAHYKNKTFFKTHTNPNWKSDSRVNEPQNKYSS
jgi:hypothetical protein